MRFVIVRVFAFGVSKAPKIQNHTKNHIVDMYIYMFPHPCSSSKSFLFSVSKKNYSICQWCKIDSLMFYEYPSYFAFSCSFSSRPFPFDFPFIMGLVWFLQNWDVFGLLDKPWLSTINLRGSSGFSLDRWL